MSFEDWWKNYPKKVGKMAAEKAYQQQIKKGFTDDELMAGLVAFNKLILERRLSGAFNPVPYPQTWLRAGRWLDDELRPFNPVSIAPREIAPIAEPTGYGALLHRKLGHALFAAYFRECEFTSRSVVAPTKTRRDMIISKFQYRFPDLIVEVCP